MDDRDMMMVKQVSQHIAIGVTPETHKHGGCYVILALDYVKQEWGKPSGDIRVTLYGVN